MPLIERLSDEFKFVIISLEERLEYPKLSEELMDFPVEVFRIIYQGTPGLKEFRQLLNIVKSNHVSVLQSHGPNSDFWSCLLKMFCRHLTWVGHSTSLTANDSENGMSSKLNRFLTRRKDWIIHADTGTQARATVDAGKSQQDYLIYPVLLKTGLQKARRDDVESNVSVRFVYSGDFERETGALLILRAFLLLKANRVGLKLLMAGKGQCSGQIYDLIYEQKVQEHVEILKNELDETFEFEERDVLICPYVELDLAKMLDAALQAGVPVLVPDVHEWKSFFSELAADVYFRAGDAYDLQQKMRMFLDLQQYRKQSESLQMFAGQVLPNYDSLKRYRELYRVVV